MPGVESSTAPRPVARAQAPSPQVPPQPLTGRHGGRRVRVNPDPGGLLPMSARGAQAARPARGFGALFRRRIRRPGSGQQHRFIRAIGNFLRKLLPGGRNRAATPAPTKAAPVRAQADLAVGIGEICIDAAGNGIAAAKKNMADKMLGGQSTAEVCSTLCSGDPGIRRGITGLGNIAQNKCAPGLFAEHTKAQLQGGLEIWQQQNTKLREMAQQLGAASFNDDVPGGFTQYGTSRNGNPFVKVEENVPQLDGRVRAWLAQGLDIAGDLYAAYERGPAGQPPLSQEEVDGLATRVAVFCDAASRSANPARSGEAAASGAAAPAGEPAPSNEVAASGEVAPANETAASNEAAVSDDPALWDEPAPWKSEMDFDIDVSEIMRRQT